MMWRNKGSENEEMKIMELWMIKTETWCDCDRGKKHNPNTTNEEWKTKKVRNYSHKEIIEKHVFCKVCFAGLNYHHFHLFRSN